MAFADRFKRRQGLGAITGYNGGSLQDQLDEDAMQQPTGQMLSAANTAAITRPRQVSPFADRFNQPAAQPNEFAGPSVPQPTAPMPSQPMPQPDAPTMVNPDAVRPRVATNPFLDRLMNDPSRQERPREVNPTDDVTKSSDYMRQISDKPLSLRDKAGLVAQNIAVNLGGTPLATRRQRDIGRAQEGLQRDLTVQGQQLKSQAIQNQMDARDAAQKAADERIAQGAERVKQGQSSLDQRAQKDADTSLLRYYNGRTDFDPEDPSEAAFVAQWQQRFGYKPAKNVRGSQLATVTGYDAEGKPIVSIINKGKGTATSVQGATPVTTEGQQNRQQRARQFNEAQANANTRAANVQAGADRRAGMRQNGVASGMTLPQKAAAEKLVARYNFIRKQEMDMKTPAEQKSLLTKQREALGNQIYATYPGMFEESDGGEIKAKAGEPQQPIAPALKGRTISQQNFDKYKQDHGDAAAQALLDGGVAIRK